MRGLSCSTACGIFPKQGSNLCPLHWQVDCLPPGKPQTFKNKLFWVLSFEFPNYLKQSTQLHTGFLIVRKLPLYMFYQLTICSIVSPTSVSSVMSDSLRPHESQHARPPCPSPTPGVHPNSCPSSRWCHPAISSSVVFLLLPPIPPSIRVFSVLCI